jgi:hypothetical protein
MSGRTKWAFLTNCEIILLTVLSGSAASANDDAVIARALFQEGRRLVSEGQYDQACPHFEKSLKLESGIGTRFNLADCWEHIGRTASAHELFLAVATASRENGQAERERVATQRAEALAPQLSRLQVKCDSSVTALRVSREGAALASKSWCEPTPIDPGRYTVASMSGDHELWKTQVIVPPQALTVLVTVPPPTGTSVDTKYSADKLPPTRKTLGTPSKEISGSLPQPAPPGKAVDDTTGIWPAAALLVGGAGVAIGTIFALLYESKNGQARDICPANNGCSNSDIQSHDSLVSDARTARAGSFIAFGLGAASITAATIYYVSRPANREKPPTTAWTLGPVVSGGSGGFWGAAAQGSW